MGSYHQGFLYMSNGFGNAAEIFNEARTASNLTTATFAGVQRYSDIALNANCEALNYVPCTMAADGTITSWTTMTPGLTNSPWYNAAYAASLEAFGFYIEEWTGLDSGSWTREQAGRGDRRGSTWGFQSMPGRVMAINVILCGSSERGLTHLFRWLESRLAFMCRNPLGLPSIWLREFCPTASLPVANQSEGLCRLDNVALLAGLSWADPPVEKAGCFLRRATFTIGAQDPCFYREPATVTMTTVGVNLVGSLPRPQYGMVAPKLTISRYTNTDKFLVVGYANPNNLPLTELYRMYPVGVCAVGSPQVVAPANGVTPDVVIDMAAATVEARNLAGSLEWADGSVLLDRTEYMGYGYPTGNRWWSFDDCTPGVVAIIPTPPASSLGTLSTRLTVESVQKFGCPA